MNFYSPLDFLGLLYVPLLVLVTIGSLVFAVLAFRLQRQLFAIIAAGALAAALFIAAIPAQGGVGGVSALLSLLTVALAVVGGGPMAVLALNLATKNTVAPGAHGGILVDSPLVGPGASNTRAVDDNGQPLTHEVLRGGLTIGILERFAVAGAILAGFPEAIAVVVAIKGVGRFTELAAPESRERFIIGTLASLTWACACATLAVIARG
ncbi:hypothetical protein E3T55_06280 [Cryobacterium frigoriphilum]|uniref:Uncharacterized protein n=1 Tax=Cryobacterium frigoriphilum TaxID=1259150 RepID=A0A4R9A5U4_9MICO|nr:hypothetical protein [Cryobacterium frigoriphilum]TFD52214.1 hypothetical protein E3T55_06280 [Cryobacterium frigoriphilum]